MDDNADTRISDEIPQPQKSLVSLLAEASGLRHLAAHALPVRTDVRLAQSAPVVVFPGYGAGPLSTRPLRIYLQRSGFEALDWGLGRNGGNAWTLVPAMIERLDSMDRDNRDGFNLIGWSQGGFNAREVARRRPDLVQQVITLGTPVVGGPKYTMVGEDYARRGYDLDAIEAEVRELEATPISVPITAIYSRSDRVVAWQACIDHHSPDVEHLDVGGSHVGLGIRRDVLKLISDRLLRP